MRKRVLIPRARGCCPRCEKSCAPVSLHLLFSFDAVRRCAKIEKFAWRTRATGKMAVAGTLCQFLERLNFLEEASRPDGRKRRNGETVTGSGIRAAPGGVYYSRDDGVKRGVIVNIFAASALSLKTMAVVQLSRFEPTSALTLEPSNLALRPLEFRLMERALTQCNARPIYTRRLSVRIRVVSPRERDVY